MNEHLALRLLRPGNARRWSSRWWAGGGGGGEYKHAAFWFMAVLGCLGCLLYGMWIPVHLFRRLQKESQDEGQAG